MEKKSGIFVAGSTTLMGSSLIAALRREGYENILGVGEEEPDLTAPSSVDAFFAKHRPDYVFHVAGRLGGIGANIKYPADLMIHNLQVVTSVIPSAHRHRVRKLLYIGSSCCYPRECPQPMKEDRILTGLMEPTNEGFSVAKTAGVKLCLAYRKQYGDCFISAIPATVFGPGDDFSIEDSHVITALLRRIYEAKERNIEAVDLWGTGAPRREFIFADDFAEACMFLMERYDDESPINLGVGSDVSIKDLAGMIKEMTGYLGEIRFDISRPDGALVKLLDSSRLQSLGWQPRIPLREGLERTYAWYLQNMEFPSPLPTGKGQGTMTGS